LLCTIFQVLYLGLSTRCRDVSSSRLDDMPPASTYRLYLHAAAYYLFWRCYSGRDTSRRPSSDYHFTSVLSRRCGLFRIFNPTLRPTALTPKAVYHPTQRTTSRRSLQSLLLSGGFSASVAFEMLPINDVRISPQYSELFFAQISTLSMRILELRAMHLFALKWP